MKKKEKTKKTNLEKFTKLSVTELNQIKGWQMFRFQNGLSDYMI